MTNNIHICSFPTATVVADDNRGLLEEYISTLMEAGYILSVLG